MSTVVINMIAMEKEEKSQTTTTATTLPTYENVLQINVQVLHTICKSLENLNQKIDRIELKVALVERKVAYAFDYINHSDSDFKSHIKKQIDTQFTQNTNMFEEEQMRLAMELSLQEQSSMKTEEEKQ